MGLGPQSRKLHAVTLSRTITYCEICKLFFSFSSYVLYDFIAAVIILQWPIDAHNGR